MQVLKSILYVVVFISLFMFMISEYSVHEYLLDYTSAQHARWGMVLLYSLLAGAFGLFALSSYRESKQVPSAFIASVMVSTLIVVKYLFF